MFHCIRAGQGRLDHDMLQCHLSEMTVMNLDSLAFARRGDPVRGAHLLDSGKAVLV